MFRCSIESLAFHEAKGRQACPWECREYRSGVKHVEEKRRKAAGEEAYGKASYPHEQL